MSPALPAFNTGKIHNPGVIRVRGDKSGVPLRPGSSGASTGTKDLARLCGGCTPCWLLAPVSRAVLYSCCKEEYMVRYTLPHRSIHPTLGRVSCLLFLLSCRVCAVRACVHVGGLTFFFGLFFSFFLLPLLSSPLFLSTACVCLFCLHQHSHSLTTPLCFTRSSSASPLKRAASIPTRRLTDSPFLLVIRPTHFRCCVAALLLLSAQARPPPYLYYFPHISSFLLLFFTSCLIIESIACSGTSQTAI